MRRSVFSLIALLGLLCAGTGLWFGGLRNEVDIAKTLSQFSRPNVAYHYMWQGNKTSPQIRQTLAYRLAAPRPSPPSWLQLVPTGDGALAVEGIRVYRVYRSRNDACIDRVLLLRERVLRSAFDCKVARGGKLTST